jgi:hypothetical protein
LEQEQEKLKDERVEGTAGGGMVTVTVTGHKEVVDLLIFPVLVPFSFAFFAFVSSFVAYFRHRA